MFRETLRNKARRKVSIHTYPHKSYLPIFDSIKNGLQFIAAHAQE